MRQNPHVRICGGPGSATTLVYPTVRNAHCSSDLTVGARVPPDRQRRPDSPEMEPESSVHRWHA